MSGPPEMSPTEARDRWLDKLRVSKREQSVSSYYYRLKLFTRWCDSEGIEKMRDLTAWDLESYEAHRRAEDVTPNTLNNEIGTLKNFLEACARWEVVDDSLPEKVEVPEVPDEEKSCDVKLPDHEALPLLHEFRNNREYRAKRGHVLLELAWHTGARVGGLRALDVRDYSPDRQYVMFQNRVDTGTPLKNGPDGERPVGLTEEVCGVLDEFLDEHRFEVRDSEGRQPFFPSQQGRPSAGTLRDWMYQITEPCHYGDCPHEKDPSTCEWTSYNHASKCPSSRSPHQVRTGAITWMLNRGMPAEVVAERVNSSVETIKKHYDKEDAVSEMEQRRRQFVDRLSLGPNNGDDKK